jgi:hypothetical protein
MNRFKLDKYIHELDVELEERMRSPLDIDTINFLERILEQVWADGYRHHMYESETYEKDND